MVLDTHDPSDPRSSTRDCGVEARSTTALRKCVDAFKAWTEKPTETNAAVPGGSAEGVARRQ